MISQPLGATSSTSFPVAADVDSLCSWRTQVIGYDMDYTCVNYNVEAWEGRAYSYGMQAGALELRH